MGTNVFGSPDFKERLGSLTLRSQHMNYSRAVKTGTWHQARESEPKDYEISTAPTRNLKRATYNRLATVTDGALPTTTYQDHAAEILTKADYVEKDDRARMVNTETSNNVILERDTGRPTRGYGAVLPRHNSEFDKFHSQTTHRYDFQNPYPFKPAPVAEEFADNTVANKRCHSQFADTADYRRPGRNTWQDESGIYSNSLQKLSLVKDTREVLPTWLE